MTSKFASVGPATPGATIDDAATGTDVPENELPVSNAGPDCFWSTSGSSLPAPRAVVLDSLDQQPKPVSPAS